MISTEQERTALMAAIKDYGDSRDFLDNGWGFRRDSTKLYDAIRAMLAPVAPDPGLREAIAIAAFDAAEYGGDEDWLDESRIPDGADPYDYLENVVWAYADDQTRKHGYRIADAVLAVLAEMLKPQIGDKVWLQGVIADHHGISGFTPVFERSFIPDVPNLAHIARFLAEHPETVDALNRFEQWVSDGFDNPTPDESIDPYGPMPEGQWGKDIEGIRSFVKAMRGECGHDAGSAVMTRDEQWELVQSAIENERQNGIDDRTHQTDLAGSVLAALAAAGLVIGERCENCKGEGLEPSGNQYGSAIEMVACHCCGMSGVRTGRSGVGAAR